MGVRITYTVDDEDAKCDRCDSADQPCKWCEAYCGPEHGWYGYRRTVSYDIEELIKIIGIRKNE